MQNIKLGILLLQHLQLEFLEFDIETHASCSWDYVEIIGKNDTAYDLPNRLCGSVIPEVSKSYQHLRITFHSDSVVPRKGFKAVVHAIGKFVFVF